MIRWSMLAPPPPGVLRRLDTTDFLDSAPAIADGFFTDGIFTDGIFIVVFIADGFFIAVFIAVFIADGIFAFGFLTMPPMMWPERVWTDDIVGLKAG